MNKWILGAALVAGAAGLASANLNTAQVGQWTMAVGGELEANLRGLTEQRITVNGVNYVYYRGGQRGKPALVLLHGYSADKDVWPRFASEVLNDFDVVIPDLAGHGETGFNPQLKHDIPSQAQRVVDLMAALGHPQFHVAGNSMGGFIAATLALEYPQQVITATAIDPAGVLPPQPSPMDRMLAEGRNPFEVKSRAEFDEFYAMTMAKPPYLPGFVLTGLAQQYQNRREELARIYQDFHRKDMLDNKLGDIKVPMLLIWGQKDALLDVSSVQVWQAGVPGLQVKVFEDLGHMPMVEDPHATAVVFKAFVQAHLPR